jgi:DNA-binding SARP family transcriptional activator/ABC-type branched-subunit amino acid transport system substrate-binding protein
LLLSANRVVSSDRLIAELWGATPPADAAAALQAHVSRLRRALPGGAGILLTRTPGYVLEIDPRQIDLVRFRELSERAGALLAEGDAERAGELLRAALELWRGRALADLEGELWADAVSRELEEERLAAVEERIEADLLQGRDAALVPELRALVREHQLRERLCGQLMRALYHGGRQAEALEVYADARRSLVGELGLEPGPALQRLQREILEQAATLEPTPRRRPGGRRRRTVLSVGASLVLAAVLATAWIAFGRESAPKPRATSLGGGLLLALDSATGERRREIGVGDTPAAIAVGGGAVWVVDGDARTVSRVDIGTGGIATFATGATPTDVAVGDDAVWLGQASSVGGSQVAGPVATALARVAARERTLRDEVTLPRSGGARSALLDNHIAVTRDAVWAIGADSSVARVDARSDRITSTTRGIRAIAVAAGRAGVWVLGADGALARLDARSGRIVRRTRIHASSVGGLAVSGDAVWVTSSVDGTLWRTAIAPRLRTGSLSVGSGAGDVTVDGERVWVANPLRGTVTEVDGRTNAIVRTIDVGGVPRSVAAAGGRVWVAISDAAAPATSGKARGITALPATTCGPVVYGGGGRPDVIVASDLPLQGGVQVSATQMAQAIHYSLRRRGFRAGRFRVAYQSCDDSVARTGLFDEARCAANARMYAGNPDVVGVIGPLNSPCAVAGLPVLNRAPGGPLAMVSPLNSYLGLTRVGPGAPRGELASLYPTGTRNYVRVFPTDDIQAAALAVFARSLGRTRVALVDDGDPTYGAALASAFERAARRLGLDIVVRAHWAPEARSYRGLAARVARTRADVVVLSGLLDNNGAKVVGDLRVRLGRQVPLLATDGFTPIPLLLRQAGRAANGTYVSLSGLTVARLGPRGRRFARAFSATQPGIEVEPSAIYAAQAAEVMLDAIGRSNGTRASIVEQLFATSIRDGLVGGVAFDAAGDMTQAPITILRAERSNGPPAAGGFEDAIVQATIRPRTSLVR